MAQVSAIDNPELARSSAQAIENLSAVFAAYNESTGQLERSYQHLQDEIVRLRLELQRKSGLLERKSRLAALGEMAAGLAHEIRNPLGGVQLYASLLERDLADQPEPLQWARKIGNGVRSLDSLVSDVLAFAQDQFCEKTSVNLSQMIDQVTDLVQPKLDNTAIEIDRSGVDAELIISADANMMLRIFLNLFLNAIDALEGQGCLTVGVERYEGDENYTCRICLADTGPGIETELLSKIFNPFFTTKDTGTGLGLAIVHRLVECHGGVISVAGGKPRGAVFTILLP